MRAETAIKALGYMLVIAGGAVVFSFAWINFTAIDSAKDDFTNTASITTYKPEAVEAEKRLPEVADRVTRQSEAFLKSLPAGK